MGQEDSATLAAVLRAEVADFDEWRRTDPASADAALARAREEVVSLAERFHGTPAVGEGNVVRAVFPGVTDAVRAAVALHEAAEDANRDLDEEDQADIRAGVAIGLVAGEGADLSGEGVDAADALCAAARPGEVRISGAVYEQARGPFGKAFRRTRATRLAGEDVATYVHAPFSEGDPREEGKADDGAPERTPEERARATVQQIKHLYRNLLLGGLTIVFLLLLNVAASADFWFQWPALFIAALLGLQALKVIGPDGIADSFRHAGTWLRQGAEWGRGAEDELRERLRQQGLSERAIRRRVTAVRGFHKRVASFAGILAILFLINLLSSPGVWWVVWPALGLAFALAVNAVHVYGVDSVLGTDWEEKKREELRMRYERET